MFRQTLHATTGGILLLLWCLTAQAGKSYSPRINYILQCQGCHLADGAGTPGKVPALKHEVGRFLQVPGGREFLIRVPGTSQSALSDAEVAGVLNWILENFSSEQLPADFVPYSRKEISRYRQPPLANVSAVRAHLIKEILNLGEDALTNQ
ncbi:MAG: cytochrome c [Proteobacteria bacterium]|nr:cytochrome c [Pseudomonadota bacterium]